MSAPPEVTGILYEPYLEWCAKEGPPVVEDFCVDLHKAETAPWPRTEARAAFVLLRGRGDYIAVTLHELAPGRGTAPQRHLAEELFLVIEGRGSTTVELADGATHSFEWGPNSLFAVPLNARYRLFNGSGSAPARLASTNDLPIKMNLIHDEDFIFGTDRPFADREAGKGADYEGGGRFVPAQRGRRMWETGLVPDLAALDLPERPERGAGARGLSLALADGNIHAHCAELPAGTYMKAHRHGPDFHIFVIAGAGYSLFWYEGDERFTRIDWAPGSVFAAPNGMMHQHFNTGAAPARHATTAMGSARFPFSAEKREAILGADVSVADGGCQIEYADQDPRIHATYLEALEKTGARCRMGAFMDEAVLTRGGSQQ